MREIYSGRKRVATMIASLALVAALVPAPGAASGAAAGVGEPCIEAPQVETLTMTVEATDPVVARGGRIELDVTVTRGMEDGGWPSVPASDVRVVVVVSSSWPFMAGEATTGPEGTAVVRIRVPKGARPGWLDGYGSAEARHSPPVCGEDAAERGSWAGKRVVRIRA